MKEIARSLCQCALCHCAASASVSIPNFSISECQQHWRPPPAPTGPPGGAGLHAGQRPAQGRKTEAKGPPAAGYVECTDPVCSRGLQSARRGAAGVRRAGGRGAGGQVARPGPVLRPALHHVLRRPPHGPSTGNGLPGEEAAVLGGRGLRRHLTQAVQAATAVPAAEHHHLQLPRPHGER